MNKFSDMSAYNTKMIEKAYEYCCQNLSHQDIIAELQTDDELKRQLCILSLKYLDDDKEADILLSNLTNNSGPIREAASVKINELIKNENFVSLFQKEATINIFLKAVMDVNPSVCRNIIEILPAVEKHKYLINRLFEIIFELFEELKDFKDYKSHVINKKVFKLYWSLEAAVNLLPFIDFCPEFEEILTRAAFFEEYTIREKSAKIISLLKYKTAKIDELISILQNDENLYVRRYLE